MTEHKAETTSAPSTTSPAFWKQAPYISWMTADTAMSTGETLRGFAVPLLAFSVSHSLSAAGWLATGSMILFQACGTFGGTIVDRHPRKPIIIGNAIIQTLIWSLASILTITGHLTITFLAILVAASSIANGLFGEATNALLRSIISMRDYPKARSINEGRDATINMAGSPIGGILYGIQPWLPFVCSAIVYMVAGGSASQLRMHKQNQKPHDNDQKSAEDGCTTPSSFLDDFLKGWQWAFHRTRLPQIVIVASLINFGITGIQYTIQLHLIGIGTQPFRIGLIDTGICAGMLLGSILANRISDTFHVGKTICICFTLLVIFIAPMLFANSYWIIFLCYTLVGLPVPIVNSMMLGFVFSQTDEHLQGRVSTAISVPAQTLSMFCSGIAGSVLPQIGFTATTGLFFSTIIASTLIATIAPAIRTIPQTSKWQNTQL